MGFSTAFKNNILDAIVNQFTAVELLNNGGSVALDDSTLSISSLEIDFQGSSTSIITFDSASGSSVTTNNHLFTGFDPLIWYVAVGEKPDTVVMTGSSKVLAIYDTGKTTYTKEDIFFLREVTLTITEV